MCRVVHLRSLPAILLEKRNETVLGVYKIQETGHISHCPIPGVDITYALSPSCVLSQNDLEDSSWESVFRVIQGIGAAIMTLGTLAIIIRAFPPR